MKTHAIKTDNAELLLVELPQGWIFNTYKDQIGFCNEINKPMTQIKGSYTLLGKPDEISEEDAKELVERIGEGDPCYQGDWFVNYQDDEYMFETAKESLLSLLETEIFWDVNPEGNFPRYAFDENINPRDIKARSYHQKWQEAEQKTFDRKRTLIFKKNK